MPCPALLAERAVWLRRSCSRCSARGRPPPRRRHRCSAGAAAAAAGGGRRSGDATHSATADHTCHFAMLGLRPDPGVSRKEVKQAFRRLAREWHPDVNPSPEASHRFQAISRAFEVLSDEQQRWEYEQARFGGSGSEGSDGGGGPGPGSRAPRGRERAPPDVWAELRLGFREAVLGAQRSVLLEVQDACGQCQGTGGQPGTYSPPCSMCKGRGEIVRLQRGTLPNGCAAGKRRREAGGGSAAACAVSSRVACICTGQGCEEAAGKAGLHALLATSLPTPALLHCPHGCSRRHRRGVLPRVRRPRLPGTAPLLLLRRGGPDAAAAARGGARAGRRGQRQHAEAGRRGQRRQGERPAGGSGARAQGELAVCAPACPLFAAQAQRCAVAWAKMECRSSRGGVRDSSAA